MTKEQTTKRFSSFKILFTHVTEQTKRTMSQHFRNGPFLEAKKTTAGWLCNTEGLFPGKGSGPGFSLAPCPREGLSGAVGGILRAGGLN
mgnify:CR=1 FL=1